MILEPISIGMKKIDQKIQDPERTKDDDEYDVMMKSMIMIMLLFDLIMILDTDYDFIMINDSIIIKTSKRCPC